MEHTDSFYFTQITEKKLAISFQKFAIFNIYYAFAPRVKLRGCRSLYFFSVCDVRNEVAFLILEHSSLRQGLNEKTNKKKHEILDFKPLLQEINRPIFKL